MDPAVIKQHVEHVKQSFMWGKPLLPIVGCVALAYFVGALGFGFWWSLFVVPLFLIWEVKSIEFRTREAIKDFHWSRKSAREPAKESVDWLNRAMAHVWVSYEDYIKKIVYEKSAEQIEKSKPAFLTKLAIENLSLGKHAPVFSEFVVHNSGVPSKLIMDCTMVLDSSACFEVAAYKGATRINIIVKELFLTSRVRVTAWMIGQEPFVSKVRFTLLERPEIDLSIKLMDHGPDLMAIPGLTSLITGLSLDIVDNIVGHPNYVDIDVAPQFYMDDDEWQVDEKRKGGNLLVAGVMGIAGGVGAVGGAAVGAVGAVGGAAVGAVGAVGGAAFDTVGAIGGGVADVAGAFGNSVGGFFGKKKK